VICHTPEGRFPGVANIGLRPTVEAPSQVNCETHIIGFAGDLYGKTIRVDFRRFLRPEMKFNSVDDLRAAIRQNTEEAAAYGHRFLQES
jgi:riboflavin kinase/FMN adenylyltransferase